MVTAFILATTKSGKGREVLEQLTGIDEIKEAYNVYGDYDVFIKAETSNLDNLNEVISKRIRNVENVAMTTTMIGL
ncbi:MAG: Lrp/AsnC ligand binding domain-containing protein [Candidatus Undinarchaeales archaeon]